MEKQSQQSPYEAFLKLETGAHTARINQLLVSPDEKYLITAGNDKTVRVWNIESKKQEKMLLGRIGTGPRGNIQRIALHPDGKYLAVLAWMYPADSEDQQECISELRIYDLSSGNLQQNIEFNGTLWDVDFSSDGKFILIVGSKREDVPHLYILKVWDEKESALKDFDDLLSATKIPLYNTYELFPAYARFVPNKEKEPAELKISAATWTSNGTGVAKWFSKKTGQGEKIELKEERSKNLKFSPESLAVGSEFTIITAHHNKDKKQLYCYDHSGKFIGGTPSETFVAQPAFSKDGKQLIVGQADDSELNQVKVFTINEGILRLKSTYYGHDSEAVAVALLADGTAVSAGGDQNEIHFWHTRFLEGERVGEIRGVGRAIHALGINEEEQIGIGVFDGLKHEGGRIAFQRQFDLKSMTLRVSTIKDDEKYARSKREYGDFKLEWEVIDDTTVNLYLRSKSDPWIKEAITGTHFKGKTIWYHPTTFGFTPRGFIITGSKDGKIRVAPHRVIDGGLTYLTPLRLLGGGYPARVNDHAAKGGWLVTGGGDQIIRIWCLEDVEKTLTDKKKPINPDGETLSPALNLFVGSDDEWVIWSKSGFYNASQRGDRRIGYHINQGADQEALYYPSDRFVRSFFRPDIIQAILEHGSEERALESLGESPVDVSKVLPPIVDVVDKGFTNFEEGDGDDKKFLVKIKFSVKSQAPVTRVWIVQNDEFVWQEEKKTGSDLEKDDKLEKDYKVELSLKPGMNRFKILAETADTKAMPLINNSIMGPEANESEGTAGGKESGKLFVLAVGVAKQPGNKATLKFPEDDAKKIFKEFGGEGNMALDEGVKSVLLTNDEATKGAILAQVDAFCNDIQGRAKENPARRDVLFVFLSGHGVKVPGKDASDPELYFGNYDFNESEPKKTGLSFMELGKRITSLPAEVILATDACNAGLAGGSVVRGVDANELAKRLYALNERGLYVLNATRDSEAYEFDELKHGVFTWAILYALKKYAEPDMSMLQLMASLQTIMGKILAKRQTPVFRMYGDLLPLTIFNRPDSDKSAEALPSLQDAVGIIKGPGDGTKGGN